MRAAGSSEHFRLVRDLYILSKWNSYPMKKLINVVFTKGPWEYTSCSIPVSNEQYRHYAPKWTNVTHVNVCAPLAIRSWSALCRATAHLLTSDLPYSFRRPR